MATDNSEFLRLRSYLNPALKGPNVSAVLAALATGTSYLVNSVQAVNSNLFITTAQGAYLDILLAQYGITRPPSLGIADDLYQQIGIEVKNRKQVRDLINNLLEIIFGIHFTNAFDSATMVEPYDLSNNDTLIVSFDGGPPVTIPFETSNFVDIHTAMAIEVADVIIAYLTSQNLTGLATTASNGLGNYVQLISSTIGPRSSVQVLGGSAQNALIFPSPVSGAGGNASTQWVLSVGSDGRIRFTWGIAAHPLLAGANPNLGKLSPGDYVNIFGGGFASSSNTGTFTIIDSVGGTPGNSYFEVYNPIGTTGTVIQASDTAMLFFNPVKETIQSNQYYGALYQVETNMVTIFLPATTQVTRRSRLGSAHLHDPPRGTFTLLAQPNPGDTFEITSSLFLVTGVNFLVGATILETVQNIVAAANDLNAGFVAIVNVINEQNIVLIQNDSLDNVLTITYSGSANIVASGPLGSNISLEPNQYGPYSYDLTQPFTVGAIHSNLTEDVNAGTGRVVQVQSSAGFPNDTGYVVFGYGTENQELAQYLAVPSATSILLSPINNLQYDHPIGSEIRFVESKSPVVINPNGSDWAFYLTDIVGGRTYCQQLIEQVIAAGITLNFVILYNSDIGLGKAGTPYSEITYIYGPDPHNVPYPQNFFTD